MDGIQWLIETSPKKERWSSHRLVGEIMGIWYGSVHTLAIVGENPVVEVHRLKGHPGSHICDHGSILQ